MRFFRIKSPPKSHKRSINALSNFLRKESAEHRIGWKLATALIKLVLPACERSFAFQPVNLFWILSLISSKGFWMLLSLFNKSPRYLRFFGESLKLRIDLISRLISMGVDLLKWMEDLVLLTFWPDHSEYFSKQWWKELAFEVDALLKRMRSSAKRRWVMMGPLLPSLIPLRWPKYSSLLMSLDGTSLPMIKRKGERGSHCLYPLVGLIKPCGSPLITIE